MASITLKFGNMRKAQDFTIYPFKETDKEVIIQSDKSIASINPKTGEMTYNNKGCYFPHLTEYCGAKKGILRDADLILLKGKVFSSGEIISLGNGMLTADNSGAKNIMDM